MKLGRLFGYALGIFTIFLGCSKEDDCLELEWFEDVDSDGRGNPEVSVFSCTQPTGFVDNAEDDNDTVACPIPLTWYADTDGDGLGNPDVTLLSCEMPEGYVGNGEDEDDSVPCPTLQDWYADRDSDGLGDPNSMITSCTQPEGYVNNAEDPDDSVCAWYQDADGDGLGNPIVIKNSCEMPQGYVSNKDDDDDTYGTINPAELILFNENATQPGYLLLNELLTDKVRLIDREGRTVSQWDLGVDNALANDAELLENGNLLFTLKVNPPPFDQGGYGGRIQMMDSNKEIIWDFEMSSSDALHHHDVEILPTGNILVMAWEQRDQSAILNKGYTGSATTLNTESIYEIDPKTDEIIWEWHVWDHMIQQHDASLVGYGTVADHPEKVNINYVTDRAEFMHGNGIDYDEQRDLIFMSVRYYSEIWVIDHGTTSDEARGAKGDLVYRFGNPAASDREGEQILHLQHHPNLLENDQIGAGNILVFSNEHAEGQSAVLEIELPAILDFNQEPTVVWSYTNSGMYSPILSGVERLPNGNTLISIGTQGRVIEVTSAGEVAWQFDIDENAPRIWRSYFYAHGSLPMQAIGVSK